LYLRIRNPLDVSHVQNLFNHLPTIWQPALQQFLKNAATFISQFPFISPASSVAIKKVSDNNSVFRMQLQYQRRWLADSAIAVYISYL